MASFTDQITQFNPYVQQLPVEAMTQVGMYKQQQYDQGVQKIQTYIDNIAGMDVYKPEQKQYLQSKLNELGSRLKTVAAGDFSNQQLVNSVGGMATQIVKDPIIQNAVYSTQVVRKGDADREAAAKAGKSSPNNDMYWEDQKAKWLNDGKVDSKFNGKYIEFWDVNKNLRDRAEEIMKHPDEYSVENPWKRDDAGNVLYYGTRKVKDPKTGKTVEQQTVSTDPTKGERQIDDALAKITIKGTSAEKLLNNFYDSIDSRDAQQLRIDAWSHYRGATPDTFKRDLIDVYDKKKTIQSQEMVNIAVQLKNPKLTSLESAKLTARLDDLSTQQKTGALDKELNAQLEALNDPTNLENFKEKIYIQKHLTTMATDMSNRSYVQEIKDNPYAQMNMKRMDLIFQNKKFKDESARGWANIQNAKDNLTFEKYKFGVTWKDTHPEEIVVPGTLPTGAKVPTIKSQEEDLTASLMSLTTLQNTFAERLFPSDHFDKNQRKAGFQQLIDKYNMNPNQNFSPDESKYLQQYRQTMNEITPKVNLLNTAKKKAIEFVDNKITSELGSTPVKGADGKTYTASEIGNVVYQMQQFVQPGYLGTKIGRTFDSNAAMNYFKTYEGGKYANIASTYIKDKTLLKTTSEEKEVLAAINKAKPVVDKAVGGVDQFTSDFLSENSPKAVIQREALAPETNKGQASALQQLITLKIAQKDDVGFETDSNPVAAQGWMTGENAKATRFTLEKSKDGSAQVVVFSPDGSAKTNLHLRPEEMNLFPQILKSSPFTTDKDIIMTSPNRTTNTANSRDTNVNPANAVTAKYTGYDLPQLSGDPLAPLVRLDIEGDWDNKGTGTDGHSVILYVQDPKTGLWKGDRLSKGYISEGGVVNILNGISKDAIQEAMKKFK